MRAHTEKNAARAERGGPVCSETLLWPAKGHGFISVTHAGISRYLFYHQYINNSWYLKTPTPLTWFYISLRPHITRESINITPAEAGWPEWFLARQISTDATSCSLQLNMGQTIWSVEYLDFRHGGKQQPRTAEKRLSAKPKTLQNTCNGSCCHTCTDRKCLLVTWGKQCSEMRMTRT